MTSTTVPRRRIALIAHDNKKQDMLPDCPWIAQAAETGR